MADDQDAPPPLPKGAVLPDDVPPLPKGAVLVPDDLGYSSTAPWAGPQLGAVKPPGPVSPVPPELGGAGREQSGPERFAGQAWDEVKHGPLNLVEQGNAINQVVAHPVQTAQGMTAQNAELAQRAIDAYKRGDYITSARHGMGYLLNTLPGVGMSIDDAGNLVAAGDYWGGLGKTLGIGTNLYAGAKLPEAVKFAATKVPDNFIQGLADRVNPVNVKVALNRVYRPTSADAQFPEITPQAVADTKAIFKAPIESNEDVIKAAAVAEDYLQDNALEPWLARARMARVQIPGDSIVDATRDAMSSVARQERPAHVAAVIQNAQDAYGGQTFSVDKMRDFLRNKNAELRTFQKAAPEAQAAAIQAGFSEAIIEAQRNAIADTLYRYLDPLNDGAGPAEIQRRTGNVIHLGKAAVRRNNSILAEHAVSPGEVAGRLGAGVAGATGKFLTGDIEGLYKSFMHPVQGATDPMIRRIFAAADDADPLPRPTGPYPTQKALPRGPLVPPSPVGQGPSYVRTTTGPPLVAPTSRQLGTPQIITPPPTPAPATVRTTTGPPLQAPASRQLGAPPIVTPEPTPPPATVRTTTGPPLTRPLSHQLGPITIHPASELSGPAGDVIDTVPVRNSVTGRIEHIPVPKAPPHITPPPEYAQGGVLRDLERSALSRRATLRGLMGQHR